MSNLVPALAREPGGLSFAFSQGPANFNGSRNLRTDTYDGAPATRTRSTAKPGIRRRGFHTGDKILAADYLPEYGRTSGGQVRIITSRVPRSSRRRLRIPSKRRLQREHLDAQPRSGQNFCRLPYNQFGYNLGDPSHSGKFNTGKNKISVLGPGMGQKSFTDQSSLTVPSMKMRQGDFSELLDPNNPL